MRLAVALLFCVGVATVAALESGWYVVDTCQGLPNCCCLVGADAYLAEGSDESVVLTSNLDEASLACGGQSQLTIDFNMVEEGLYNASLGGSEITLEVSGTTLTVIPEIAPTCITTLAPVAAPNCSAIPAEFEDLDPVCTSIDDADKDEITDSESRTIGAVVGPIGGIALVGFIVAIIVSSKNGGLSAVTVFTFLFIGAGTALLILGTGTDQWATYDIEDFEGVDFLGFNVRSPSHIIYAASPFVFCEIELTGDCVYVDDDCKIFDDEDMNHRSDVSDGVYENCNTIRAERALAVLACAFAIVTWLLAFCIPGCKNAKFKVFVALFAVIGAIWGLTAMAIFADEKNRSQGWFGLVDDEYGPENGLGYNGWEYDFSFALFIVGWVFLLIGGVLALQIQPSEYKAPADSRPVQATQMTAPGEGASSSSSSSSSSSAAGETSAAV